MGMFIFLETVHNFKMRQRCIQHCYIPVLYTECPKKMQSSPLFLQNSMGNIINDLKRMIS